MAKMNPNWHLFPRGNIEIVSGNGRYLGINISLIRSTGIVAVDYGELPIPAHSYFDVSGIARRVVSAIAKRDGFFDDKDAAPFWYRDWKINMEAKFVGRRIADKLLPLWRNEVDGSAVAVHKRTFSVTGKPDGHKAAWILMVPDRLSDFMNYRAAVFSAVAGYDSMYEYYNPKTQAGIASLCTVPGGVFDSDIHSAIRFITSKTVSTRRNWLLLASLSDYTDYDWGLTRLVDIVNDSDDWQIDMAIDMARSAIGVDTRSHSGMSRACRQIFASPMFIGIPRTVRNILELWEWGRYR